MGFVVIATWTAADGQADHIRRIIEEVTPSNRAEPKMIRFEAHVSLDDPNTFVLYEHYTDPTGYDDHRASEAFRTPRRRRGVAGTRLTSGVHVYDSLTSRTDVDLPREGPTTALFAQRVELVSATGKAALS